MASFQSNVSRGSFYLVALAALATTVAAQTGTPSTPANGTVLVTSSHESLTVVILDPLTVVSSNSSAVPSSPPVSTGGAAPAHVEAGMLSILGLLVAAFMVRSERCPLISP